MNIFSAYWNKICEPLDGFLWHKDISHPIIRPLLRNMILAGGGAILAGAALYSVYPNIFWFAAGLICMTWIFWSWARFFLRISLHNYGAALLRVVFSGFLLRLGLLAVLLYAAMAIFRASAIAIIAGMVSGAVLGLASYAWHLRKSYF